MGKRKQIDTDLSKIPKKIDFDSGNLSQGIYLGDRSCIVVNAAACLNCRDVLISRSRHDFKTCHCGSMSVDGGFDYIRRLGDFDNIIDLSVLTGCEVRNFVKMISSVYLDERKKDEK